MADIYFSQFGGWEVQSRYQQILSEGPVLVHRWLPCSHSRKGGELCGVSFVRTNPFTRSPPFMTNFLTSQGSNMQILENTNIQFIAAYQIVTEVLEVTSSEDIYSLRELKGVSMHD
jgi:hypothetical protein